MNFYAKASQLFHEIADYIELSEEKPNPFRIRAYRRAAESMRAEAENPEAQVELSYWQNIPGLGADLLAKLEELKEHGEMRFHKDLQSQIPSGLLELLEIRGLGPKKVRLFWVSLGVDNKAKLLEAAKSGELAKLPKMGAKSQEQILASLESASLSKERIPYELALKEAQAMMAFLEKDCENLCYAGSLRRERESIGDIDLLATGEASSIHEKFCSYPKITQVLAHGETKSSIVIEGNIQMDLRTVPQESFGAALLYFTGSKAFNIRMRTWANTQGLKLNEYGVFRGEEKLAGETEMSMFEALKFPYHPPTNREDT